MQKIIRKYAIIVVSSAIFLILFINSVFAVRSQFSQQLREFELRLARIQITLKSALDPSVYQNIFANLPTKDEEIFFAIDKKTGNLLGCSGTFHSLPASIEELEACKDGSVLTFSDQKKRYVLTQEYHSTLLCASIPVNTLISGILTNLFLIFLCLIAIELIVLALLNHYIKTNVIDGVHDILSALTQITNGNLDTVVSVDGNPEFKALSSGINSMVQSIFHSSDLMTKIIDMSEMPLVAFEYKKDTDHLFITSGLKKMLALSDSDAEHLFEYPSQFFYKIQELLKKPAEGETDIYRIGENHFVRIHMSLEPSGYLGVITDVSGDICKKQQMLYESTHDHLTGLFRYQYFKNHAIHILTDLPPGKICACVMLDLDNFKEINDTYGHDFGDKYLQHFSHIMQLLPEKQCLLARRSGDEFCFFTYYYSGTDKLRQLVTGFWELIKENPLELPDHSKKVIGVSGGFAWTSHSDMNIDLLMNYADKALYDAKWHHKGTLIEYR